MRSLLVRDFDQRVRLAIQNKRLLKLRYQARDRVVEPHDYGVQGGHDRLLVYQLQGPVRPRQPNATGWRLLDVSKIESLEVLEDTFRGSRGAAHHNHQVWDAVYARVG